MDKCVVLFGSGRVPEFANRVTPKLGPGKSLQCAPARYAGLMQFYAFHITYFG